MVANIIFRFAFVFVSLFSTLLITPGLYITSPSAGSTVSGIVEIRGSIPAANFSSAKIAYAYDDSDVQNWFQIAELSDPMQDVVLAKWDTTTITDGIYRLKLSVTTTNGTINEVVVEQVTVMNYTHAAATSLPNAVFGKTSTPITSTEAADSNEPTMIPVNPAAADSVQLASSMVTGVVLVVILLAMLLIYTLIRGSRRRR